MASKFRTTPVPASHRMSGDSHFPHIDIELPHLAVATECAECGRATTPAAPWVHDLACPSYEPHPKSLAATGAAAE